MGEQAGRAVEQRVQQETNKLVDKAIGSVEKTLDSVQNLGPTQGKAPALSADAGLGPAGIVPTSLNLKAGAEPVVSVYCTFEQAGAFTLEARLLNQAGLEIGRGRQKAKAQAGDGRFVDFPVDPRTRLDDVRSVVIRMPPS